MGGANHFEYFVLKGLKRIREKSRAAGDSDKQRTERTPCKFFRCGSIDNLIAKFLKPPKDNKKRQKKVCFIEMGNCGLKKVYENGDNDNDQKICIYGTNVW